MEDFSGKYLTQQRVKTLIYWIHALLLVAEIINSLLDIDSENSTVVI